MPWDPTHKRSTRQRIVEAAAEAYRERGVDGISTADVMKRAGLTHGGFYAHFASKDELVAEAIGAAATTAGAIFAKAAAGAERHRRLSAVTDSYLSSRHREHPETGCPIPTLAVEVARQSGVARMRMAAVIQDVLAGLTRAANSLEPEFRQRQAAGALALMVGGIVLARTVEDSNEADRLLDRVRQFANDALNA